MKQTHTVGHSMENVCMLCDPRVIPVIREGLLEKMSQDLTLTTPNPILPLPIDPPPPQ